MTKILKEKTLTNGLNSVNLKIEKEKNRVFLNVSFIENKPYKITEKKYNLSNKSVWQNREFLFQLKRLLNY